MTKISPRLPDFVIVGAAKAATTWLQRQLQQHQNIYMPNPELHYFSRHADKGTDWYLGHFAEAPAGHVLGEKSNSYLDHPAAAAGLKELLPDARLIVQLRNPIERAYSDYCMLFRRSEISPDIARELSPGSAHATRLLEGGLYSRHLERFFTLFAPERILFTLYDDVAVRPDVLLADVCGHIGVSPLTATPRSEERVKDKNIPRVSPGLRHIFRPFKNMVAPVRDKAWFRRAHALFARPIVYPELNAPVHRQLADYYQDDIQRLERLIGRNLQGWIQTQDAARSSTQSSPLSAPTAAGGGLAAKGS